MLALEDYLDTLKWAQSIGGLKALTGRVQANYGAPSRWVKETSWIDFLAEDEAYRSPTSVCLKIVDPAFTALDEEARHGVVKKLTSLLEKEGVALDTAGIAMRRRAFASGAARPSSAPTSKPSGRGSNGRGTL